MAVLIGMSADVKGKNYNIDRDEFTLGRSSDNAVVLGNHTVSGRHCTILREGDHYVIRDHGSTNGTRVNSKEIKEGTPLRPKDLLQVGAVEFLFNSEEIPIEDLPDSNMQTQVLITQGPTAAPDSFNSISPFGARRRDNPGVWIVIIVGVGILALGGVAYFFYKLVTAN
jgi:pSer/pThr/pTyr-binding forkhead associated (FHA) protein